MPRDQTLDIYFDDLRSTVILPEPEVRRLIAIVQSTDQRWRALMADGLPDLDARAAATKMATIARNRVVEGNLRLVVKLAKRYEKYAPKDELVAEGNLGLFTAIDRFDLTARNHEGGLIRFSSYAGWWIRNRMSKMVAEPPYTGQVHVPNYLVRLAAMDEEQLNQKKIAASTRLFLPYVRASLNSVGLTERAGIEDDEPWDAEDKRAVEPGDELVNRERLMNLAGSLERLLKAANLTDREATIIHDSVQTKMTLQQISDNLAISRERVRQIKVTAMYKIRRAATRIGFKGYSHAEGQK